MLQKFLIVVICVEELDDIYEIFEFVEFVLEKRLMLENYQEWENQVGNCNKKNNFSLLILVLW